MKQHRIVVGIAVVLGLMAAVSVAYAAIPDGSGVIHGCYVQRSGNLRVVDPSAGQSCVSSETQLNWNSQGPPGIQGPKGDPGPAGPSDAFALEHPIGAGEVRIYTDRWTTVAAVDVPTGDYVVGASLFAANTGVDPGLLYCVVRVGDENAQAIDTTSAGGAASQGMTAMGTLAADGQVTLQCRNNGLGGDLLVETFNIEATKVGALHLTVERG
jgi:hypothetical protein